MRYHHQIGAMRERKGIGKGKIALLILFILPALGYVGFLAALPSVGGWPIQSAEEVANKVRTVQPGVEGDRLYIPGLNVAVDLASRDVAIDGEFGMGKVGSITAQRFAFGVTPQHILSASPFYRLDQLREGDEFYIDHSGTRYAYKVSSDVTAESHLVLATSDGNTKLNAEPIGIVAWHDGEPRIEVPQEEIGPLTTDQIFEGEVYDPSAPVPAGPEMDGFVEPEGGFEPHL